MADEFTRPDLNQQGEERMDKLRRIFTRCLDELENVPLVHPDAKGTGQRERALVVTKLQEAKLWAERALLLNRDNLA